MNTINIVFSEKQASIIRAPFTNTLEVNEGTPRSGKTTTGHFRYARYLLETRDENHLIVAYNQEQAYRLFIDGDGTGLMHIFGDLCEIKHDELGSHLLVYTKKGKRKVYYKGGGKSNSVGAITGMSLGSVVFCEINLLNMKMIQECFRRTFAAKDRFHLADLNPPSPQHPVISEVFNVQDMKWTHWTIDDNPILTEKRKQDIYRVLSKSDYLLKRDWYGQRVMPEGIIYSMFDADTHIKKEMVGVPVEMFFVADGGQSDATSCSCNIVTNDNGKFRLYRVANYYHSGSETGNIKAMSIYARELRVFIQRCESKYGMERSYLMVDPACLSLREELELIGIKTEKAMNNSKDVKKSSKGKEVGIERTQNALSDDMLYLIEDTEYPHNDFLKEIGMYVRINSGEPIDAFNHALDELRYSVNYFYKTYIGVN